MRKLMVKKGLIVIFTPIMITISLLLMALAFLIPTKNIYNNVNESLGILVKEGNYFSISPGVPGTVLDNATEAVYLNEALVGKKNANIFKCILSGYTFSVGDSSQSIGVNYLNDIIHGDNLKVEATHNRFFNGYEIFLKPMLFFMNYSNIRQFNMFSVFLLSYFLCLLLSKRGYNKYIFPIIISILLINPITISLNMTYVGFYYCMIIPCIIMLLLKKSVLKKYDWLIFEIIGACAFCFNMNYFQLLTFTMPYMIYLLICGFPKTIKELVKSLFALFTFWFIGYVGVMILKWLLYAIIDPNVFSDMYTRFMFRTGTDRGARILAISKNLKTAFGNKWWNIIEILFILHCFIKIITNKCKIRLKDNVTEIVLLLIMILMPICRCFILANHVTIHYWTTYRIFMIPVLAFNMLLIRMEEKYGMGKH